MTMAMHSVILAKESAFEISNSYIFTITVKVDVPPSHDSPNCVLFIIVLTTHHPTMRTFSWVVLRPCLQD